MIAFDSVELTYPSPTGPVPAVRGVTFEISGGERVALLGANGSGKSTLALLANGIHVPDSGRVVVDGLDTAREESRHEVRAKVQVVFQNPDNQIVATRVADDVAFGPENLGLPPAEIRDRVAGALASVGLTGMDAREPHLLSGGQKQRLAIAGALAMAPDYLLLDEPTAMLDPRGREDVREILRDLHTRGKAVVHITHDIAEAAEAERVIVLEAGRVRFDGSPADLLARPERLAAWGMRLPAVARIAERLRDSGIALSRDILRADALAESLWP